jgi:hypothetical protein
VKRLIFVLTVAGLLAVFAGGALAQTAPQGTEQTALQGTEQTSPQQGTLDAKNLDDDASGWMQIRHWRRSFHRAP